MSPRSGRGAEIGLLLASIVLFSAAAGWRPDFGGFDPTQRSAGIVRVVTWNVGQELLDGAPALLPDQEDFVAKTLLGLDADVACLQELSDEQQAERLCALMGAEWSAAVSSRGAGRYAAILAKGGNIERARLRGVGGRAVLAAVSIPLESQRGLPLLVASVHAAAFSSEERNELLGSVRLQLDTLAQDVPRILAGDFNIDLDPNARRDLFSDDSYLDVQTYNAILGEANGRPELRDVAANAGPTAEPDRRLDYVLVERDAFEVEQAAPLRDLRAPGMDHGPVLVDLRPTGL